MKRTFIFILLLAMAACAMAQNSPCPGLKNPASFTSGSTYGTYVGYYSGQVGEKADQEPNAMTGATGVTLTPGIIPASQLANTSDNGGSSYCGASLDPSKEFRIMSNTEGPGTGNNVGKDPLVNYALPYCPTQLESSITKSIRIGNCQIDDHAEALYYTLDVNVHNALLFIYYSIVVQAPGHSTTADPAFVIRVCRQNSSGQWVPASDTLCYAINSHSCANGVDGWHSLNGSGGTIYYRDWNKVAVNLNKYLYEEIRLEIFIGDCNATGHYGYCYIAGDCQSMDIGTSGCPAGNSNVLDTLRAPRGLDNYVWYKCNQDGQFISSLTSIDPSIGFTQLTPNHSVNNTYTCTAEDFMVTEGEGAGELTNNMVFRCDMTSAMDPAKPFVSKLYSRVINTKPLMAIDTLKNCNREVLFLNNSYVPNNQDGCDIPATQWWFQNGAQTDSIVGDSISYQFDTIGTYQVKCRSFYRQDHGCYSDSTYTVFVLGPPDTRIEASALEVCDSEVVILRDVTPGSVRRDWIIYNDTNAAPDTVPYEVFLGNYSGNNTELRHIYGFYKNPVKLRAYNGLFARDSVNANDTNWCFATDSVNIEVFQHPELHVSGDTIVCNGQNTDITVATETPGCTYRWYRHIGDNNQIAEGDNLQVLPYDDTCLYYVKVISTKQCVAWDSVNAYRVNPTLSISRHDMCEGDFVTLTADKAYSFSWTAQPTDSALFDLLDSDGHGPASITVSPKQTTVYTLVGHGTNDCNAAPLSEQITIHPIPEASVDFSPSFVDSDNPVVTLTDVSPYSVRRVWYFNDGTPLTESVSPCSHNFGEVSADSVNVTLVAYNDLECSDTLNFALPVTQFTFYAPNVFTPERPDNNVFSIFTANEQQNFSVFIYDRQGRQVFSSEDLHFKWNGTTPSGIKCPQGAYVYVIQYRRPGTEDIVTQKGTITLLR